MAISRAQMLKELLPGLNALFGLEYEKYEDEHTMIYETENSELFALEKTAEIVVQVWTSRVQACLPRWLPASSQLNNPFLSTYVVICWVGRSAWPGSSRTLAQRGCALHMLHVRSVSFSCVARPRPPTSKSFAIPSSWPRSTVMRSTPCAMGVRDACQPAAAWPAAAR